MTTCSRICRGALAGIAVLAVAACGAPSTEITRQASYFAPAPTARLSAATRAKYAAIPDGGITVPAIPAEYLSEAKARQLVDYYTSQPPGTIIVDPYTRYLYHVQPGNKAMRYAVAVGEAGYGFSGQARVAYTRAWPNWTPTQNMIKREPEKFAQFADGVPGGLENPLGARALYLYRNGRDTYYRIHGTPSPWTIGHQASSGCIRMYNQDVMHLARNVSNGTKVVVLTREQSGMGTTAPAATDT